MSSSAPFYLDEYLDTLTAVPSEVQRALTRMAELDTFSDDGTSTALNKLIKQAAEAEARDGSTKEAIQAALLLELERCAEKRAVANALVNTLARHQLKLEDDIQSFQEELRVGRSERPRQQPRLSEPRQECTCNGKGKGEMVGCENPDCPREWFHLQCVGLARVPAGQWFCAECSRDRYRRL
jgi:hypothetical protein